jgi:hypothetical protein
MEDSEMASEVMEDKNEEMDKDESMTEEEMEKDESMTEEEMEEGEDAMEKDDDAMMEKAELNLNFENLSALGSDYAYEGWIIVDSAPHSTGIFTVSDDGSLSETGFMVEAEMLKNAAAFVLTIEPSPDTDPAPSAVHILAGDFDGENAQLVAGHPAALGNDFADAGGAFILGIPTSDSSADSYTSGIWFTSLDLPELPEGWIYEGWVAGTDGPITTGTFSAPKTVDTDGGGPTAGPKASPAFPGQDFLNPPVDLTSGFAAVISIEPVPDNSPAPFVFKPLVNMEIVDAGDHVDQLFTTNIASFPFGSVSR